MASMFAGAARRAAAPPSGIMPVGLLRGTGSWAVAARPHQARTAAALSTDASSCALGRPLPPLPQSNATSLHRRRLPPARSAPPPPRAANRPDRRIPPHRESSLETAKAFFQANQPKRGKAYGRAARSLMHQLQEEQVKLRDSRRKYELPKINSGDVVKITFMESCVAPRPPTHLILLWRRCSASAPTALLAMMITTAASYRIPSNNARVAWHALASTGPRRTCGTLRELELSQLAPNRVTSPYRTTARRGSRNRLLMWLTLLPVSARSRRMTDKTETSFQGVVIGTCYLLLPPRASVSPC